MPTSYSRIVLTVGAMRADKMHIIKFLADPRRFPLHLFVKVDPCEIRCRLPQYPEYIRNNPETAGENTRTESGYILETLFKAVLEHSSCVGDSND